MCDAIYIGNTQQKFNKRMDGNFSDVHRMIKNGKNQAHLLTIYNKALNVPHNTWT